MDVDDDNTNGDGSAIEIDDLCNCVGNASAAGAGGISPGDELGELEELFRGLNMGTARGSFIAMRRDRQPLGALEMRHNCWKPQFLRWWRLQGMRNLGSSECMPTPRDYS